LAGLQLASVNFGRLQLAPSGILDPADVKTIRRPANR
jgi:hypothetical protein